MKIGIGITTHNRIHVFNKSFRMIKKYLPKDSKLIVVDDGSRHKIKESTFRFNTPNGIAKAKNKCLELLEDCDYIFLFDDDVYPIKQNWHLPFIEASKNTGCHHFNLIWDKLSDGTSVNNDLLIDDGIIQSYKFSQGVVMFYTKECIQTAGGLDVKFGRYGDEHWEYSGRIHNLGLTPYKFCHVKDTMKYFYSYDHDKKIISTMNGKRKELSKITRPYLESQLNSKEYKPYK